MNSEIGCVHFVQCSGCVINSCKNPPEIFSHASKYFSDNWQIELGFSQGDIRGWRSRAKLAVRPPGIIGLFEKGTHHVVAIPQCQVHHPSINEAVRRIKEALDGASIYDEATHKGDLRYIQCVVERSTGKVQLSLVLNMKTLSDTWFTFCQKIYDPKFFHSIWFNSNNKPQNTIFGKFWQKIIGPDVIWENIAGLDIAIGPSHFGQANLQMYERLILDLQKHVMSDSIICELYSGIGVIGLSLAKQSKEVRLVELEPTSKMYFTLAADRLDYDTKKKLYFIIGKAETSPALVEGADVLIVDPPRKGLGIELTQKLLATKDLKEIAYISCEWKSLERDLDYIKAHHPEWKVSWASSYLFFPGTNQIETLVILTPSLNSLNVV
ncbi:MAG: hypothetical protein LLF94_06845 [Chlamydiales bacterium]|nr:hypothetical protein [Chlamydiales bacterium]